MRKLFGNFLVERGIVDAETLLGALIAQLRSAPSFAELVYEHRLLDTATQLKILEMQFNNKIGFHMACTEIGVMNTNLDATLAGLAQKKHLPIGQILLRDGKLTSQQLMEALDLFVAECPPQQDGVAEPRKVAANKASFPEKKDDRALQQEYCDLFDQAMFDDLKGFCRSLRDSVIASSAQRLQSLHAGLDALRFFADYAQLTFSARIIEEVQRALSVLVVCPEILEAAAASELLERGIAMLWEIRNVIAAAGDEGAWLGADGKLQEYEELDTQLTRIVGAAA